MTLLQLHLIAVAFWLGVLAVETVLELAAHSDAEVCAAARAHRWIDILLEIPVVLVVIVTGSVLLVHAWPAPTLLLVKVGAGLVAVAANLVCIPLVHGRSKATDVVRIRALTRQVKFTGLGLPFWLVAFWIGLGFATNA